MSVVLLILKIIGIVLLCIVGLLLIAVACLLFCPFQYRIIGDIGDKTCVKGQVSWLLHLVHCNVAYDNKKFSYKIRILGIPIGRKKRRKKSIKKVKFSKEKNINHQSTDVVDNPEIPKTDNATIELNISKEKKENHILKKIKSILKKIKDFPGMIKEKWVKLKEKIRNIKETVSVVCRELKDEGNRKALSVIWKEVKYLLKHFSPRKARGDIVFGTQDPATTGQVLGVISMLPFVYRYQLCISPDFETTTFHVNGEFSVRGHVRFIHLLISIIHLLKDKNIKNVISKIRNL